MRLLFFAIFFIPLITLAQENHFDEIRDLIRKAEYQQAEERLKDLDNQSAEYLSLRGSLKLRQGQNQSAIDDFISSISMLEANENAKSDLFIETLSNAGTAFLNTGSQSQALEYLLRAKDIRREMNGEGHESLAASYNDIGLVYLSEDPGKALENYQKALEIYEKNPLKYKEKIAQLYVNTGIINQQLEINGAAIDDFDRSIKLWRELFGENHPNEALTHVNLAQTYKQFGVDQTAFEEIEQAIKIYESNYGKKHPDLAYAYNILGNFHLAEGEFGEALTAYQEALIANIDDFNSYNFIDNPNVEQRYNSSVLINSLLYKARALEAYHFGKTLKFSDLENALKTLEIADRLADELRQTSTNENDKIALGKFTASIYEAGVRISFEMYQKAFRDKDSYLEKAFFFSERSKSAALLEAISDTKAKSFSNIPENLLSEELNLKSSIAFYEQKLAEKPKEGLERSYRAQLFNYKRDYEEFITKLEKDYPQYYDLKYSSNIPRIVDVQSKLTEGSLLVSYFFDEPSGRFYTFYINKDKAKVYDAAIDPSLDRYLSGLRNSIYFRQDETYRLTASSLFKWLFPKSIKNYNNIIVIPSGRLGVIPFETFLTEKIDEGTTVDNLPFLINKASVGYFYSASLFLQNDIERAKDPSIFLCAPVTFNGFDKSLSDLPATLDEVQSISKHFQNKGFSSALVSREESQEALIKERSLNNYSYLHFATHGYVDEYRPELSRIFLAKSKFEDGNLYTGEIYNLKLQAELVTLSACQTGLGKISKGEGIIGLSRALLYAGAENLIVSLWSVADQSTSNLMVDFYDDLISSNSISFSNSLRSTKLNMIKNKIYSDPYYWAPFILVGK
ncbi:MAG: CHAT domain-containing tetratricopeptide repeat protein [Bacteroidota bacterium]